jgi:hypothetical protein
MKSSVDKTTSIVPVGGSSTHIVLEFPNERKFLYMGSVVSLSYSVYRDKTPVFALGQNTIRGFGIGNKYVAGSMVLNMFLDDEIATFINEVIGEREELLLPDGFNKDQSYKETHTYMRDDITSFNIHAIFSSEYHGDATKITIYDANFVNNGQVMSVDDIVTESTASFVAKDVREQHRIGDIITPVAPTNYTPTGSQIVLQYE